jgi:hypothetical protein
MIDSGGVGIFNAMKRYICAMFLKNFSHSIDHKKRVTGTAEIIEIYNLHKRTRLVVHFREYETGHHRTNKPLKSPRDDGHE